MRNEKCFPESDKKKRENREKCTLKHSYLHYDKIVFPP